MEIRQFASNSDYRKNQFWAYLVAKFQKMSTYRYCLFSQKIKTSTSQLVKGPIFTSNVYILPSPPTFTANIYVQHLRPTFPSNIYVQRLRPTFMSNVYVQRLHPTFTSNVYVQRLRPTFMSNVFVHFGILDLLKSISRKIPMSETFLNFTLWISWLLHRMLPWLQRCWLSIWLMDSCTISNSLLIT